MTSIAVDADGDGDPWPPGHGVHGRPGHADGATITNPDGTNPADYTYVWSQVSGRTTSLSSTTAANPTYTVPSSGANPTTAACTSGTGTTRPTSANCPRFQVIVTKINTGEVVGGGAAGGVRQLRCRPVRSPTPVPAQNVKVGSGTVTLDGSGSTQAQGHAELRVVPDRGSGGDAVGTNGAQPTFTAPNTAANYTFSLVVTDTQSPITSGANINTSLASTVAITVSNYASPVASSGLRTSRCSSADHGDVGRVGFESGRRSHAHLPVDADGGHAGDAVERDGDPADVHGAERGDDAEVHGDGDRHAEPEPGGGFDHEPRGHDRVGDFASPIASPGPDQTVHRRDVVTLDASGSSQADGHSLTYLWTQTAGTPVTLSEPGDAKPTFTAPEIPGSLKFTVTVTDTQNPNPVTASTTSGPVQIDVQDYAAPIADAGPNQSNIDIGTTVTLDGSASRRSTGTGLTYSWTQAGGPAVTLSSTTAQKPTFTAPTGPVTLGFQLTVDDTFNTSAPATVFVNVNGIAGLDFAAQITGDVRGEKTTSPFTVTVVNNGVLTRSITSAGLAGHITRNSVAVPSSEYSVAAKTVSLAAHKQANFTLTWNHGTTALHLGDDITVSVCVNQLGDSVPANNCGVKTDPPGPLAVFAWPKNTWTIKSTQTLDQPRGLDHQHELVLGPSDPGGREHDGDREGQRRAGPDRRRRRRWHRSRSVRTSARTTRCSSGRTRSSPRVTRSRSRPAPSTSPATPRYRTAGAARSPSPRRRPHCVGGGTAVRCPPVVSGADRSEQVRAKSASLRARNSSAVSATSGHPASIVRE